MMVRRCVAACLYVLVLAGSAAAQDEAALKAFFEGKRVVLKTDMPATSDGVDVQADARQAIDYRGYGERLKRYGTALRAGDSVGVTLIKVKKDLIEFQLAGGGYGTFGDDTSTSVYLPDARKTHREEELEKLVRDEDNREHRRRLERELEDLRERRERENRRLAAERVRLEEEKRERIAERRLRGGSRFNLRYDNRVPAGIRPDDVMAALSPYVDFVYLTGTTEARRDVGDNAMLPPPTGDISQLRKGLSRGDAERLFGRPVESTERREGGLSVRTLVFVSSDQRISADFVDDVLVRYTISSK